MLTKEQLIKIKELESKGYWFSESLTCSYAAIALFNGKTGDVWLFSLDGRIDQVDKSKQITIKV